MLRKLNSSTGTSLAVQWLRLCAFTVGGASLITGWGTKIPHAIQWSQKKKKTPLSYIAGGNVKNGVTTVENSLAVPQKVKQSYHMT